MNNCFVFESKAARFPPCGTCLLCSFFVSFRRNHLSAVGIGCGVVGASAAYELARYKLRVAVLEAAADIAAGTTKANSAIIHAGYDPEPGTLMARLNVEGNRLTGEICEKLQVPFKRVGSLVVAFSPEQLPTLRTLYDRGCKNGVPGLRLLSG